MKISKLFFTLFTVSILHVNTISQDVNQKLPSLILNEINIEDEVNDDIFIELVVTNANEIAHNVLDPRPKIIIDDSNTGSSFQTGFISIRDSCIGDVLPGDIIVIHGRNTSIGALAPEVKTFSISDPCIQKWDGAPSQTNSSYTGATLNSDSQARLSDFIDFSSTGNHFQVRTNETYVNKTEQTGASNYSLATSNLNEYAALPKSMGVANSPANLEMIEELQAQTPIEIDCELIGENYARIVITSRNPNPTLGNPEAIGYTGPYKLETPTYTDDNVESNTTVVFNLECGINTIRITDIYGRSAECSVMVGLHEEISTHICGLTEVVISDLVCDIDSDCISVTDGDNEPETLQSIEGLTITPDQENHKVNLKYSDKDGNVIHEVLINIIAAIPGEPCDDEDACTDNDIYDEACECRGEPAEEVKLIFDLQGACSDNSYILVATEGFERYEWYLDRERLKYDGHQIVVEQPGTYLVAAANTEGCFYTNEYFVSSNYTSFDIHISASGDVICNDEDIVTLSIPDGYSSILWKNSVGTYLNSTSNEIEVNKSGDYTVSIENEFGCQKEGTINIRSAIGNTQITPQYPTLCSETDEVELAVEYAVGNTYNWSTGETSNSILATSPGTHTVTITSPDNCISVNSVDVTSEEDLDISKVLMDNGFFRERVLIREVTTVKGDNNSSSRNDQCEITSNQSKSYNIIRTNDPDQEEINLEEWIKSKVNAYRCGAPGIEGVLVDHFCPDTEGGITLSEFVSKDENLLFKYYMEEGEVDTESYLYYWTPLNDFRADNSPTSDKIKRFLYEILCARSKGLNIQMPNYLHSYWYDQIPINYVSAEIQIPTIEQDKMDIGEGPFATTHPYVTIKGITISNYRPEAVLLTGDPNNYISGVTDVATITVRGYQDNIKARRLGANKFFYEIKIPYDPSTIQADYDESSGDFCTEVECEHIDDQYYLFIYLPLEDFDSDLTNQSNFDKFNGFFNRTSVLINTVLDITPDEIESRRFTIEDLPLCLFGSDHLCDLFLNYYRHLDNGLELANTSLTNADPTLSPSIIDCFDYNYLVDDFANMDNSFFGGGKTDLYRHLSRHWFSLQPFPTIVPTDDDKTIYLRETGLSFDLDNNLLYGIDIDHSYSDLYFYLTKGYANTNNVAKVRYFDSDPSIPGRQAELLHTTKQYDYLNQVAAWYKRDNEIVNVKVPGVYIAYAVSAARAKTADRVFNNVLDIAGLFLGYTELAAALKGPRLLTARSMLAGADVAMTPVSLFLTNADDYCYDGSTDLCKNLRSIHRTAQILLLSGNVVDAIIPSLKKTQTDWRFLDQESQNRMLTNLDEIDPSNGLRQSFLNLMDLNVDQLLRLKNKYGDILQAANNNDQVFRNLLSELDPVKAWEKLIDIPNIRVSVKSLETVSKWVDDGIELTFEAIQDGAKIINKNGDEVGELVKIGGDDVLAISDDFFVAAGTPKSFGTITVNSNTGEIFANPGYIKNADGTIGFIEDVSSYGTQLIQNTIKQRGSLRGTLTGITKTQDAHHIIPVQLLKENDVVKKAVEAGFDFNKASNGMAIEKYVKATGQGRHGPHPQYTNQIRQYLNDWASQNPGYSAQAAMDELTDIVASVRNTINTTTTKINDLPLGL